jgi:UDP-galactopyranose mutase
MILKAKKMQYDFLIVGAGLFGAVFAHQAGLRGKHCLVIDRREHAGGNLFCASVEDINVHQYGAHIFHTNDVEVWRYVGQLAEFNNYVNCPVANFNGELYNLPFNMNTFYQMWGVRTPEEAQRKIAEQVAPYADIEPQNLEEQALRLVGPDIYTKLIKGYTEKQWGRSATSLPAFIIRRLPLRFTFDNNYFNHRFQGIPIGGYNVLINGLLEKADVQTGVDFHKDRNVLRNLADRVVYTGMIDEYFDNCFGRLEYRSLEFETFTLDCPNYQGNAVINFTDAETPYTRVIEHKHFEFGTQPKTVITREYPRRWAPGREAYYPVNDAENSALFARYQSLAAQEERTIFGGRLADYAYYDMDVTVRKALDLFNSVAL